MEDDDGERPTRHARRAGCLAWYPFYYCSGVWPVAFAPPETDITPPVAAAIALLYGCGWVVTRGANAQKYLHKTREHVPSKPAHIPPKRPTQVAGES